jgi:hypothetical protein
LRKRPSPERHNFSGRGSYLFIAAARWHDIRPSLGQSPGDGESDTARSADYHRRFVC